MGDRSQAASRAGFRRSRRLRRERRGVVAVIGTLLALLVFFALFGVFLTQYVPLWMEDNESMLANQIETSLATLKSGVDDQYILGNIPTYSVPFTLSSQTVPLIAQPTVAGLALLPGCAGSFNATTGAPNAIGSCVFERLSLTAGTCATGCQNQPYNPTARATDYLVIQQPNRYLNPLEFYFENDGLSAAQSSSHQWMLVPPPLNITKTTGNLTVRATWLTFLGNASSYDSEGSKTVTSHFVFGTNVTSIGRFLTPTKVARTFNVTLTLGVHDVCGWYNYLNNTSYNSLGASSSSTWTLTATGPSGSLAMSPPSMATCVTGASNTDELTLTIFNVNFASAFVAETQLSFNAGGL